MSEKGRIETTEEPKSGREIDDITAAFLRIKRDRFISGREVALKSMSAEEWGELAPRKV